MRLSLVGSGYVGAVWGWVRGTGQRGHLRLLTILIAILVIIHLLSRIFD